MVSHNYTKQTEKVVNFHHRGFGILLQQTSTLINYFLKIKLKKTLIIFLYKKFKSIKRMKWSKILLSFETSFFNKLELPID